MAVDRGKNVSVSQMLEWVFTVYGPVKKGVAHYVETVPSENDRRKNTIPVQAPCARPHQPLH